MPRRLFIVSISRCALASSSPSVLSERPLFRGERRFEVDGSGTTRCFASAVRLSAPLGSGFSPSTALALVRCHHVRGARQARPLSSRDGPDAPFARLSSRTSDHHGSGGRQRSRSSSTDISNPRFCYQDGHPVVPAHSTPCFPHVVMARASRRYSQPRRGRPHHERLFTSRSVSARTEHASSPAWVPDRARLGRVHQNTPRPIPRERGPELGASPRWSRPASPNPRERGRLRRWPEASSASAACLSPTFGARSSLVPRVG